MLKKIIQSPAVCLFGVVALLPLPTLAQSCDRACLEALVDTYLDAVIANDPSAVPLSSDVRFTENGQRLEIGDGLWNTMKSKGEYRIFVTDVPAQQVTFIGTIGEDHREPDKAMPVLIGLRLRLENSEITEVEQFVGRDVNAAEKVAALTPRAAFSETVPANERMSRADLLKTANMYFSGMQRNDGKGEYPFADNCNRLENGSQTTNAPVPAGQTPADPANATTYSAQWSCMEQFKSGLLYFVNRIRDRRFVAVDEERGLVLAFGFFDHSGGEFRNAVTPAGKPVTGGPVQPWTWYIVELFKVENGKLGEIEALLQQVPYGMSSGWSTYEDGMSSELQDVTLKIK
ncbi:MAG: hypothetical protein V4628_05820 [Pseudomonadota bacterium]